MKKTLMLILILFMMFSATPAVRAEGDGEITIKGTYYPPFQKVTRTLDFPYADEWFDSSSTVYNHKLVQASIGLADVGNRVAAVPYEDDDKNVRAYTEAMGFGDGSSEQFNQKPTKDTIGSYISSKKIGNFTVICVAMRGQGYQDEWMSNFLIGTGVRHEGFSNAAWLIEARIRKYITDKGIEGKKKLWIAGFSRAAAVSNITAADMIDSGLFADVFAFCFACPRTTREPVSYPGIYNVIGAADPVPMVPFADWGFGRYGTDYYLPTQETDSTYPIKALIVGLYSGDVFGDGYCNNVSVNHAMHTLLEYILNLCPTQKDYADLLQGALIEAWTLKGSGSIYEMVVKLLAGLDALDSTQQKAIGELADYLTIVTSDYLQGSKGQKSDPNWSTDQSIGANLFVEHNCDTYTEWLLASSDGEQMYTPSVSYVRFVISSQDEVSIDIYDQLGYVQSVDGQGGLFYREIDNVLARTSSNIPLLYSTREGTQTILVIPEDADYMLALSSAKNVSIRYFGTRYDGYSLTGQTTDIHQLDMKAGEDYFVVSQPDKEQFLTGDSSSTFQAWDSSLPYSPSLVMHLENMNVLHLTFSQIKLLGIANVVFLLAVLIFTTVAAIRRKIKKVKVREGVAIGVHLVEAVVFLVMQQVTNYYMPAVPEVRTVFCGFATLAAVTLAFSGYAYDHKKSDLYITIDLSLCMIGDFLVSKYVFAGSVCYLLGGIVFCVGFGRLRHPGRWQWIAWAAIEAVFVIGLFFFRQELGTENYVYSCLYYGLLFGRLIIVLPMNKWLRIVPMLYIASDILKGITLVIGETPVYSLAINVLYYSGVMLLAVLTWYHGELPGMDRFRGMKTKKAAVKQ